MVCPYCEALTAQGEVGCLLQGIDQARELHVHGAVVGLGGVAEPAAHTADFPTRFAAVQGQLEGASHLVVPVLGDSHNASGRGCDQFPPGTSEIWPGKADKDCPVLPNHGDVHNVPADDNYHDDSSVGEVQHEGDEPYGRAL